MNPKSLFILAMLFVAAAGLAYFSTRSGSDSKAEAAIESGALLLRDVSLDDVAGVFIQEGSDSVTISRDESGQWTVAERAGYKAGDNQLTGLIRELFALRAGQVMRAGPSQHDRLRLSDPREATAEQLAEVAAEEEEEADILGMEESESDSPFGTVVGLLDSEGEPLMEIILGTSPRDTQAVGPFGGAGQGQFVRIIGNDTHVVLVAESVPSASADPADWIDKSFFAPGPPRRLALGPAPEADAETDTFTPWAASRATADDDFTLEGEPATLSTGAASGWSNFLVMARPADLLVDDNALKGFDPAAARVLTFETFDGLVYEMTLTPEAGGNPSYHAVQVSVTGEFVEPEPPELPANDEDGDENGESPTADEILAEHQSEVARAREEWEKRLAREQDLARHIFKLDTWTFNSIWKTREDLIEAAPPEDVDGDLPPLIPDPAETTPQTDAATPAPAPRERVSVTTEPIAIPPLPTHDEDDEQAGDEDEDQEAEKQGEEQN